AETERPPDLIARPDGSDRYSGALLRAAHRYLALDNDQHLVALCAPGEDELAGVIATFGEESGDPLEIFRVESGEHRHPLKCYDPVHRVECLGVVHPDDLPSCDRRSDQIRMIGIGQRPEAPEVVDEPLGDAAYRQGTDPLIVILRQLAERRPRIRESAVARVLEEWNEATGDRMHSHR